jgi:hypothetical protein
MTSAPLNDRLSTASEMLDVRKTDAVDPGRKPTPPKAPHEARNIDQQFTFVHRAKRLA